MLKTDKIFFIKLLALFLLSASIILLSMPIGVFWDNITFVSDMGNALYNNGILNWMSITPDIDPGHPPFLAMIMAATWKIFGKSLWISHLVMLPFVFGFLYQLYAFVIYFLKDKKYIILAFVFAIADPTLLAQLVTVNLEVLHLFFFFMALNGVLYQKNWLKTIGIIFLGIISYRGMMLGVGVFLIDFLLHSYQNKNTFKSFFTKNRIINYAIGSIPAIAYIFWRLYTKGWLISNPLQTWGDATDFSSNGGFVLNFLRNITVLIHRYIDFGRFSILIFIVLTLIYKRKSISWKRVRPLLIVAIFSVIIIVVTSLILNNPMGHRYFIPSYLGFAVLAFVLLQYYQNKKIIFTVLLMSLLMGNFLVYPDKISQGWDASLAHLPYWELRQKAIKYLDENEIKINNTASFFPNNTSIDAVDLNDDQRTFLDFSGNEDYILYSNVFNIKDGEYEMIESNYVIIKSFKNNGIRIEILKKK